MGNKAVHEFLDQVTAQDDLRDSIRSALDGSEDRATAAVALAGRMGFAFTSEEFLAALQERYGDGELSDDALEGVAGGVFPASAKGGGICLAFPDVCKTPSPGGPVPIPYPNIGIAEPTTTTKSTTKTKT